MKKEKTEPKPKKAAATQEFPRYGADRVIKIPQAILEQNAGKQCTSKEAAKFCGTDYSSTFRAELAAADKYGLVTRPSQGIVAPSEIAKQILRPQNPDDVLTGYRAAILQAPILSDVYQHYRGENLPDEQFFKNALTDKFGIPKDRLSEFVDLFKSSLALAKLSEEHNGKIRILDVQDPAPQDGKSDRIKKLEKDAKPKPGQVCFVMMPFGEPIGGYYKLIYEPAIEKAGLRPVRADNDIFGTGKIMDQIWSGINTASVLVAELTDRNPNVSMNSASRMLSKSQLFWYRRTNLTCHSISITYE